MKLASDKLIFAAELKTLVIIDVESVELKKVVS
jgi:hypothetical protein